MATIKNIIFDLGGVLLNLDYEKTRRAFESLGISNFNDLYSQAQQSQLFDLYETGKISENEFLRGLKQFLPAGFSDEQIIQAWNAMLLDLPEERLDLLRELKNKYRIFLLSNTNDTHIDGFEKIISQQHDLNGLEPLFEQVYYSSRIGMRKPNKEIFEFVINQNQLHISETVFFDDSFQHIEGAASIGLKAIFVKKPNSILDYFDASYQLIES